MNLHYLLKIDRYFQECVGKLVSYPTTLDKELCDELCQVAAAMDLPAIKAKTAGTNDFYEGKLFYLET